MCVFKAVGGSNNFGLKWREIEGRILIADFMSMFHAFVGGLQLTIYYRIYTQFKVPLGVSRVNYFSRMRALEEDHEGD